MSDPPRGSDAISPTADYTGYVWARNGLSHPALSTHTGRVFYETMRVPMQDSRVVGGVSLEAFLLAPHRLIGFLLKAWIEDEKVSQVVEIACGMSPRGWRFAGRYGDRIPYVEAGLARNAQRPRGA